MGGRLLYIEKLNHDLSKAYKMTKYQNNYSKDFYLMCFQIFISNKRRKFNLMNKLLAIIYLLFANSVFAIDIDEAIKSTIEKILK